MNNSLCCALISQQRFQWILGIFVCALQWNSSFVQLSDSVHTVRYLACTILSVVYIHKLYHVVSLCFVQAIVTQPPISTAKFTQKKSRCLNGKSSYIVGMSNNTIKNNNATVKVGMSPIASLRIKKSLTF